MVSKSSFWRCVSDKFDFVVFILLAPWFYNKVIKMILLVLNGSKFSEQLYSENSYVRNKSMCSIKTNVFGYPYPNRTNVSSSWLLCHSPNTLCDIYYISPLSLSPTLTDIQFFPRSFFYQTSRFRIYVNRNWILYRTYVPNIFFRSQQQSQLQWYWWHRYVDDIGMMETEILSQNPYFGDI